MICVEQAIILSTDAAKARARARSYMKNYVPQLPNYVNNLKNLGWAKKGILSFSYVPLDIMSSSAIILCGISLLMILGQLLAKLLFPQLAPRGFATLIILIVFFGSLNVLAVSVAGEYIAKIFEEVKQRPHFIRRSIIRDGEVRLAAKESS